MVTTVCQKQIDQAAFLLAIESAQRMAKQKEQQIRDAITESLSLWQRSRARSYFDLLEEWNQLHECTHDMARRFDEPAPLTIVVDSWFLHDLVVHLTPGADEQIAYVTGPRIGQVRVLSRICTLDTQRQSPIYALGDAQSCSDALIQILDNGCLLHCMAHCHPGKGERATHPSSIDDQYMNTIQSAGADAIGIIVTRDFFVRFFTSTKQFEVRVLGAGVKQINEAVYKIDLPQD
ncbi:MAG: hypothetical protein K1Y02_06145 [Candidatus Hydrogenedentes bacterium]|nr:hypothetical protein [Candidatus Hydrogenedentota bacterium]